MPKANKTGVRGLTRTTDGRWIIDLRWTDRKTGARHRHHERLPASVTAAAAKARARDVLNAALDGQLVEQKAEAAKGPVRRLHAALDEVLGWAETHRPRTLGSRRSLVRILKAGFADAPLDELVPFAIERYRRDRSTGAVAILDESGAKANRKSSVAPATVNREIAALKHAVGLWASWGWMDPGKAAAIRAMKMLREPPGRVRHLSPDEEERLLVHLPGGVKLIVLAADLSGMRRGEVVGLQRSAVDLPNRTITLVKTKTNKVRHVPIADALAPILEAAMREATARLDAMDEKWGANAERQAARAFVFLSSKGRPYTLDAVTRAFQRAAARAGLEDVRFHDCRHTFATNIRRAGAGLDLVADLLGHAQVTTSQRYTHIGQEQLHAAVAALRAPKNSGFAATLPPADPVAGESSSYAAPSRHLKSVS